MNYPDDYAIKELAGTTVKYEVEVKAIRTRAVPELDDEFAKDLGEFDVAGGAARPGPARTSSTRCATRSSATRARTCCASWPPASPSTCRPRSLDREIDRRVEEFVRRLIEQQIDPMKTNINWEEFRERQRDAAVEAVKGALVLDEVARREHVEVSRGGGRRRIGRYAERTGRTAAAVRARLEKEGGLARLYSGLRREKTVDFLLGRATVIQEG